LILEACIAGLANASSSAAKETSPSGAVLREEAEHRRSFENAATKLYSGDAVSQNPGRARPQVGRPTPLGVTWVWCRRASDA